MVRVGSAELRGFLVDIQATGGELQASEYEDKILEALKQAEIKIEEESKE